jgi:transcriptional regulator with XRE-family HTH domain
MSSLFYKSNDILDVKRTRLPVVMALQESLRDYVRRIISEKGLNYREVSRRTGGAISHATVGDIVNGVSKDVRTATLRSLAKGLGVSEDEVFAVARGKEAEGELSLDELHLLHCFRAIPPERRTDALGYLDMLFNLYGSGGGKVARVPVLKVNQNDKERERAEESGDSVRPPAGRRSVRGGSRR